LAYELGDILWFIAQICTENSMSLDEIAAMNLSKLKNRKERGVIKGNGDTR